MRAILQISPAALATLTTLLISLPTDLNSVLSSNDDIEMPPSYASLGIQAFETVPLATSSRDALADANALPQPSVREQPHVQTSSSSSINVVRDTVCDEFDSDDESSRSNPRHESTPQTIHRLITPPPAYSAQEPISFVLPYSPPASARHHDSDTSFSSPESAAASPSATSPAIARHFALEARTDRQTPLQIRRERAFTSPLRPREHETTSRASPFSMLVFEHLEPSQHSQDFAPPRFLSRMHSLSPTSHTPFPSTTYPRSQSDNTVRQDTHNGAGATASGTHSFDDLSSTSQSSLRSEPRSPFDGLGFGHLLSSSSPARNASLGHLSRDSSINADLPS